ncbi:MAG: M48 family metallopeptidase [candidate division KSB1 bacterium]|nr:M48 family metallopeptidase [candidate division KSB1 bacterium]MDZ7273908.1 M48 family metallopeptidase [candidate division KSB1 bacterium]MDZ7286064.1 M48 family metallopeptidase [candidate division KSB1 bacterium]MDZ7299096.1 M48 family metallopeptidase [candidate division KSB1 bacterium]MDZ7306399.1 M48 family metallopeptidase [candidate division KSB1 bacterium]
MPSLLILLGAVLALSQPSFGQTANPQVPDTMLAGAAVDTLQHLAEEAGPVAVPPASEKALRYYRSGNWLWGAGLLWGLLVPAMFVFTGFSARLRHVAQKLGRRWFFVIGIYFILFSVINFVLDFPLNFYEEFVRQHAYGLSNQTFGKWLGDALKALLVGMISGVLFLWMPYLLLKKSPRRWWLYTGILTVPFLFFFMLISPIWIAPLYNKFGPMQDRALEAKILALAERAGIAGSRVFEVNKSVDTKTVNAYVSGFLGTKRIVLWDTIIAKLKEEELMFVMGHEMGHYVLGHVVKSVLFFSALILVVLYAVHRTAAALQHRYHARFGFHQLADIASLPLLMLLFHLFFFLAAPAGLAFMRHNEHEADRFGLEICQNNRAAAQAFVKLQTENLSNPRPGWLYKLWRASHPPVGERIDFCNSYRPWEKGEALRYGELFQSVPAGNK